ncbi:MAG TPA: M2 family metallopeptidase [Longimicrobiaceae bacterium]|nr:M2 family metallopeptidase [Longimicrobiaceae bacterium]
MKANRTTLSLALLTLAALPACAPAAPETASAPAPPGASAAAAPSARDEAQRFLEEYEKTYQGLYYASSLAEWASNTRIVEGDTTNAARTRAAQEALTAFTGSVRNIERVRALLERRDELEPLQARQLEKILYTAAAAPQTAPEVVKARIAAETRQTETLYGYQFTLGGKPVTPNQLDEVLRTSRSPRERQAAWEASKAVGPTLKPGIVQLRDLRNGVVQALGYPDYFSYQVSDYGMSTPEMLALNDRLVAQLWPLYRELHTWARYELADRYDAPVPDLIPAHWLPNRWAQDWSALVEVQGLNADSALATKSAEWVVKEGERFYVSLGFPPLPESFWTRSSLYPVPADAPYKKNTHASAWHLDLGDDVRSLMSVEPNSWWFETANHELGHVYYYINYTRPEVPLVLREGANRAYHEAIGSMIGLAASQRRFLVGRGLVPADAKVDERAKLLNEALAYVPFIPFSAGTMTRWEHSLYADSLSPDRFNRRWWELAAKYQGIAPPAPRGEEWADALTKTHVNDDPAQYYDYALSYALLFQMHNHIARNILKQDPHDTDYHGSREVGEFLRDLMAPGASRDWREVLRETTGQELDAQAMVDYFAPLREWLEEQNRGRKYTLPETPPSGA